jgi:diaminohydroxyphosphoribosylaminopyrimidine deaminase / 5-amino-6-(5-phosphoribosylamino)uracil reductase
MLSKDELFMQRCFDLAASGRKNVRPNPQVGAILVYQDKIIGEGYHKKYGGAHAEVEAINSVKSSDRHFIPESTLYVSLEPCNFHGNTPACSSLILEQKIKKLVVSAEDPNPKISGSSLKFLEQNGVKIVRDVLKTQGQELIKVFSKNITSSKPYVILKIAESKDHFIGKPDERIKISNQYSDIFVHKLRDFSDGIMIGTNTALIDNPTLTTRLIEGENPVRIIIDRNLKIPGSFKIYNQEVKTIIINQLKDELQGTLSLKKMDFENPDFLNELLRSLFKEKIYVLIVEGGAKLINSFLQAGEWDEAIVISALVMLNSGIKTPLFHGHRYNTLLAGDDVISFVKRISM